MSSERVQRWVAARNEPSERGAIIPMTALLVVVMIVSVALSVDTGLIASRKRDLRSVTDLVTLDVARIVDARQSAAEQLPELEAAADQSAVRNGHDVAAGEKAEELTVVPGVWASGTGFTACGNPADCYPNAVRILAGETVPRAFAFFSSDRPLDLFATGVNPYAGRGCLVDCTEGSTELPCVAPDPRCTPCPVGDPTCTPQYGETLFANAGLTVGSFVARLDTTRAPIYDAVVNGLLGIPGDQQVTGIGYQGLAAATVALDDLAAELGFGSVQELLDAEVTAADVLEATAEVLDRTGSSSSQVSTDLARLSQASTTQAAFTFGDVYDLSVGDGSTASASTLNVGDLLFDVAQASAASNLITGGNLATVSVPVSSALAGLGVSAITADLAVIEPPQRASGPAERVLGADGLPAFDEAGRPLWQTRAATSQVAMRLAVELASVPVRVLDSTVRTSLSLPFLVQAGSAVADLERIACDPLRTGSVSSIDLYGGQAHTSAGKLALGTVSDTDALLAASSLPDFGAVAGTAIETLGVQLPDIPQILEPVVTPVVAPVTGPLGQIVEPVAPPVTVPPLPLPGGLAAISVSVVGAQEEDLLGSSEPFSFTGSFLEQYQVGGVQPTVGLFDQLLRGARFEPIPVDVESAELLEGLPAEVLAELGVGINASLHATIDPLSGELNQLIDDLNAGFGLTLGGADVIGGPRPFRFEGADPNPRAADCPAPIPFLVE